MANKYHPIKTKPNEQKHIFLCIFLEIFIMAFQIDNCANTSIIRFTTIFHTLVSFGWDGFQCLQPILSLAEVDEQLARGNFSTTSRDSVNPLCA